jgi:hypothetical protein
MRVMEWIFFLVRNSEVTEVARSFVPAALPYFHSF